jgi:hypothetical protein
MNESEGPGDGSVYGAFISQQLDDQRDLKDSLERRASSVITSSGVLVTLLFGLTAITTSATNYRLPEAAHTPLVIALGAFVASSALALIVGIPIFRFRGAAPVGLEAIRLNKWRDRDWVARRRVAGTEVVMMKSYKRANRVKAWFLVGAGSAQIVALVALSVTVAVILTDG